MNRAERIPYLDAGDSVLTPLGFRRKKRDQEWRRTIDGESVEWVHLNFGLSVINPSFGVHYAELDRLIRDNGNASWGTSIMLSTITHRSYDLVDTSPDEIANDLLIAAREVEKLRDRSFVIKQLEAELPKDWPVASRSMRMRLLPLLLAGSGRISEALEWIGRFETLAPVEDQMVPLFGVFASNLREHFNA